MSKTYTVYISLIILILWLGACDLLNFNPDPPADPVTITERIDAFEADLNSSDRSGLYLHFHPTETDNYNQLKDAAVINAGPLSSDNGTFHIVTGAAVPGSGGRQVVEGTLTHDYAQFAVQFIMLQYGEDWQIEELKLYQDTTLVIEYKSIGG